MLASAQSVLHRAVVPIVLAAGFPGEDRRIVRQRATGSISSARANSIADARTGVVEASHLQ
jgi:hypothetical protein